PVTVMWSVHGSAPTVMTTGLTAHRFPRECLRTTGCTSGSTHRGPEDKGRDVQRRTSERGRGLHLRPVAAAAVAALMATGLAACGSGDEGDDGTVELTIATFNEFGYEELIDEWNDD